jgi:hypothetical protein
MRKVKKDTIVSTTFTFSTGETLEERHVKAQYYGFWYSGSCIFPVTNSEDCTEFTISFLSQRELANFKQKIV